jgi:hypothetical protein
MSAWAFYDMDHSRRPRISNDIEASPARSAMSPARPATSHSAGPPLYEVEDSQLPPGYEDSYQLQQQQTTPAAAAAAARTPSTPKWPHGSSLPDTPIGHPDQQSEAARYEAYWETIRHQRQQQQRSQMDRAPGVGSRSWGMRSTTAAGDAMPATTGHHSHSSSQLRRARIKDWHFLKLSIKEWIFFTFLVGVPLVFVVLAFVFDPRDINKHRSGSG